MRLVAALLLIIVCASIASSAELDQPLAKLRAVGPKGAGHKEAMAAWKTVAASPATELPAILAAMDGAGPLAENWIRSAAETVAQRERGKLPVKTLESYLNDTQRGPRSRRLAYELIAAVDDKAEERLIPGLIDDPSLELRRDAVALAMAAAEKIPADDDKANAISAWRKAFTAARDLDQIKLTSDKLKALGEKVHLPRHFGFITHWQLIGPFDNKQTKGFDVAYPPEAAGFVADATYDGVSGEVKWIEHTTVDEHGVVDLNKALAKHKGAIAYAYADFDAAEERTVDFRLGSINGNKLWVNGELIFANHVYHANAAIDQYVGQAKLKKGRNTILLKIAQNEQTEPWAQEWQFQLRICDRIGTAVLEAE